MASECQNTVNGVTASLSSKSAQIRGIAWILAAIFEGSARPNRVQLDGRPSSTVPNSLLNQLLYNLNVK